MCTKWKKLLIDEVKSDILTPSHLNNLYFLANLIIELFLYNQSNANFSFSAFRRSRTGREAKTRRSSNSWRRKSFSIGNAASQSSRTNIQICRLSKRISTFGVSCGRSSSSVTSLFRWKDSYLIIQIISERLSELGSQRLLVLAESVQFHILEIWIVYSRPLSLGRVQTFYVSNNKHFAGTFQECALIVSASVWVIIDFF